jgi:hypothetical protein
MSDNVVRAVEALVKAASCGRNHVTVGEPVTVIERCPTISATGSPLGRQAHTPPNVRRVIDAGSVFVVAPVFKAAVVANHRGLVLPALTRRNIHGLGSRRPVAKVFPAKAMGVRPTCA